MTFSFKEQIKVGNKGQDLFMKHYHHPLVIFPEHKADFKRVTDGKLVELKSDSYDMEKTPYFFIERYSDLGKKSPGSVWQSWAHKVPVFVYMFTKNNTYFEFSTKELVAFLTPIADEIEAKGKFIHIRNPAWTTAGFKLKREDVKHLYKEYRFDATKV